MKARIIILSIAIIFTLTGIGFANDNNEDDFISDEPMSIEQIYKKMGYTKNIAKTIKRFEKQFNTKVIIPKEIPFKVHLSFVKIEDNNILSLDFIGENKKDIFKLTVNPNKPFNHVDKVNYKLNNGNPVFIVEHEPGIRQLYMEKGKFEYILGISNSKKKQELIKVAEYISNK